MIKNCTRCGTIFNKVASDICPTCVKEESELMETIRLYLKEHKMATIADVVRDTEIPVEVILDFIEDNLIVLVDNPNMSIQCSRCGKLTQDGRLCANCKNDLVHELAFATRLVRDAKKSGKKEPHVIYRSIADNKDN